MVSSMVKSLNSKERFELELLLLVDELVKNGGSLLEEIRIDLVVVDAARADRDDKCADERLRLAVDLAELGLDLVEDALVLLLTIRQYLFQVTLVRLGRDRRGLCALAASAYLTPL